MEWARFWGAPALFGPWLIPALASQLSPSHDSSPDCKRGEADVRSLERKLKGQRPLLPAPPPDVAAHRGQVSEGRGLPSAWAAGVRCHRRAPGESWPGEEGPASWGSVLPPPPVGASSSEAGRAFPHVHFGVWQRRFSK